MGEEPVADGGKTMRLSSLAIAPSLPDPGPCSPGAVSLHQIAQFLAEPLEHPALGHADRPGGHAQVGGDVPGRLALDGGPPKGLPGPFPELAPNQLQPPAEKPTLGRLFLAR